MQQQRRRNRVILGVLSLGLLAGAALTAGPAQAATGPGPYYAEPAWDQKILTATRFLVMTNWGNQAVLDMDTGLVWERSPALTTHTWSDARFQCTARETGNRKGWRLPSVHELASLVLPSVAPPSPALPPGDPFLNVQSAPYWSATASAEFPATHAWLVDFGFSGFVNAIGKSITLNVWCVRGGMNAEAY